MARIDANGDAVRGGAARFSPLAFVVALSLGAMSFAGPARAQMEWANKIFGSSATTSSFDRRPSGKTAKETPLDDLRKGDQPLRSEAMLKALDLAYGRYKAIAARGGWPIIPSSRMIRPGDDDERIPTVRKRLAATGELKDRGYFQGYTFDGELEAAVRHFQKRHGLAVSGRVDRGTIAAMNVPVQARLAQIKLNYDRLAALIDNRNPLEDRYILVNVPGFQLEAVEGGRVMQRHRVIAGRPGRETPVVKAAVRALNFFPYWRVPDSVAKLDVAPRLVKEPDYLAKEQIRVLNGSYVGPEVSASLIDWSKFDPVTTKLRQDPGPQNALGLVRLDMPNEHGVYMHDTPMKPLFGRAQRAFSAGCVRVQDVFDLAAWVANGESGLDRRRVDEILSAGAPVDINLSRPVPVYFTYITAWADAEGHAEFRPDIYGRDGLSELSSDRERDPDAPPPPPPTLAP
ncbi:MAG: L,D-transpeptidase family protein [Hyphomicrobiaceae bacterium]